MTSDTAGDAVSQRQTPTLSVWTRPRIVAIVLLRGDGSTLPAVQQAIAAQRRSPDEIVVVHMSRDASEDPAADGGAGHQREASRADRFDLVPTRVLALPAQTSTAQAVAAALNGDGKGDAGPAETDARGDWIWLLTGSSAPEPDALQRLLTEIETSPSVAVAGCKQVEWRDRQRLRDVGVGVTRLGAVVTGLDRGELDQGQHDARRDVLAVRLPGMLVRRDIWLTLGGPDEHLRSERAEIDLCRRVRLLGHRVVVVPGAVVASAETSDYACERQDALLLRLAWTSWPMLAPALVWSVLAGLGRALSWVVLKQPARGLIELTALAAVLGRPKRWIRMRSRSRAGATVPVKALRPLGPSGRALMRQRRDEVAAWVRPSERARGPAAAQRVRRRVLRSVLVLMPGLVLGLAAALAAGRRVLGSGGALASVYVAPMPDRAGDLWQVAESSWRPVGIGSAAVADPLAGLLAVLSWPLGGDPGRLVAVLLLAGPALAALTAWIAAAGLRRSLAVRGWTALAWAAAPPLLGATSTGRPGAVLAHVLLPLLVLAGVRALAWGSMTAAAGAGLMLTAVLAAAPALALPSALLLIVSAVLAVLTSRGTDGALAGWRRLPPAILTGAIPAVLLLPWWTAVARAPRLLFADPAVGWQQAPTPERTWWHLTTFPDTPATLLGLPSGPIARLAALPGGDVAARALAWPHTPAMVAGAFVVPLLLLAITGLFRLRGPAVVALTGWLVALAGLAAALAGERIAVGDGRAWSGPALSFALAGLLVAAVGGGPVLSRRLRRMRPRRRSLVVLPVALALLAGPVAMLAGLAAQGWGPATAETPFRVPADVLPTVAAAEASGAAGARTLVIGVGSGEGGDQGDRAAGVRWSLLREAGPRFGNDSVARRESDPEGAVGRQVVDPVVAALLTDTSADQRGVLADLAVGTVLLLPPVDAAAEQALDSAPGLVRVSLSGEATMWRVEPPSDTEVSPRPSRIRVIDPVGDTSATPVPDGPTRVDELRTVIESGEAGRRVVLAEAADAGWQANLDGLALQPVTVQDWAQGFDLPRRGGVLEVVHRPQPGWLGDPTFAWIWWAALALALLLALPLPRMRQRIGAPLPPTPTHRVHRAPGGVEQGAGLPLAPQVFDAEHPAEGDVSPLLPEVPAKPRRSFRQRRPEVAAPARAEPPAEALAEQPVDQSPDQSVDQSVDQSPEQSVEDVPVEDEREPAPEPEDES